MTARLRGVGLSTLLGLRDTVPALGVDMAQALILTDLEDRKEAVKADKQIAALTEGIGQSSMPYTIPDSYPTFGSEGEIPLG